jgi:hypothetical protein
MNSNTTIIKLIKQGRGQCFDYAQQPGRGQREKNKVGIAHPTLMAKIDVDTPMPIAQSSAILRLPFGNA